MPSVIQYKGWHHNFTMFLIFADSRDGGTVDLKIEKHESQFLSLRNHVFIFRIEDGAWALGV